MGTEGTVGFEFNIYKGTSIFSEIYFFLNFIVCTFLHAKCIGLNEILDLGQDSLPPNLCTTKFRIDCIEKYNFRTLSSKIILLNSRELLVCALFS